MYNTNYIIILNILAPTEDKTDDVEDIFYEEMKCVFNEFCKYHMKILLGGVKITVSPHRNVHKFIWTSPDGKTHNQIDYIVIVRRRHSNVLDV
jgi:hypothetical protein